MSSSNYISTGLIALANNTQAGAFAINSSTDVSVFSTSTGVANSCILPANMPSGVQYTITLASGATNALNVFPPVGGQIDSLAINTARTLAIGGSMTLISASSNQYFSVVNQGFSITPVIAVAAGVTKTLLSTESGSIISLAATATKVNLPAPVAGLQYTVITSANPGNDIPITATGALLNGVALGAATPVLLAPKTTLNFTAAQGKLGDRANFLCDGTNWSVDAHGQTAGAFTVA